MEILKFLFEISYKSPECVSELKKLELPLIITEELIIQTKEIEGLSKFTISLLSVFANILDKSGTDIELSKDAFVKSLAVCICFGESAIRIPAMICLCILFFKVKDIESKELLFTCLLKLWKKLGKEISEPTIPLCLACMYYYSEAQETCSVLFNLEEVPSKLVRHLRGNETSIDMDFYIDYCQIPIIRLVKCLSVTSEQRTCFVNKGIMQALESIIKANNKEIRELANNLLILYCTKCEVLIGPTAVQSLLEMVNSKDENTIMIAIKCLNGITKQSENNALLIKNNCIQRLIGLLSSSKQNLVVLCSDVIAKLMQSKEGQEQFVQNNGVALVFPFVVILYLSYIGK